MAKVLVLGSTGMLGSAVKHVLDTTANEILTASRTSGIEFDALELGTDSLLEAAGLTTEDYVINCVGLTKARIDESSAASRAQAVRLNFDFPHDLATAALKRGVKIIQVATDCVFSGEDGGYSEAVKHDALDVYGKTKSLGEIPLENVMHLRCSLIGPEVGRSSLFFEWVRQLPHGAKIDGYVNHLWNGLSSLAFARIVSGVIDSNLFEPGVQHLVPGDSVTKDGLIRLELGALSRDDVTVVPCSAETGIDRTLSTLNLYLNARLFQAAGYESIPTIAEMVEEACEKLPN